MLVLCRLQSADAAWYVHVCQQVLTTCVTQPHGFTHLFLKLLINSDDGLKKVALPCIHPSAVGLRGAMACSPLGRTGCARRPATVSAVPASAQLECSASSSASRTQTRKACQSLQPHLLAAASKLGGLCSLICTISGMLIGSRHHLTSQANGHIKALLAPSKTYA